MNNPAATTDAQHDQRLADLLTLLTERQQRGEPTGLEELAREHPDLADELRRLWAAVQVAGTFGRPRPPRPTRARTTPERPTHPATTAVLGGPAAAGLPRPFGD